MDVMGRYNELHLALTAIEVQQIHLFVGRPRTTKDDTEGIALELLDKIEVVIAGYNLGYTIEAGIAPYRNIGKS